MSTSTLTPGIAHKSQESLDVLEPVAPTRRPRPLRFVQQHQTIRRKRKRQPSHIDGYTSTFRLADFGDRQPLFAACTPEDQSQLCNAATPVRDFLPDLVVPHDPEEHVVDVRPRLVHEADVWSDLQQYRWHEKSPADLQHSTSIPLDTGLMPRDLERTSLLRGIQYATFADQAGAILDMYDDEFCVLPLTMDCHDNPFRVPKDSCQGSPFLLHAVLAISAQHLAKKRQDHLLSEAAQAHQATALQLFRTGLDATPGYRLLETLLILINFEATQSAFSAWEVHLNGARQLLDVMGIENACRTNSRTRAQVAMLVWWDITVSFISRRRPSLPMAYLQTLQQYEAVNGWTFFTLNGCHTDLVTFMARLTKLASIYEQVAVLDCVTFHHESIDDIARSVRCWQNPEDVSLEDIAVGILDVDTKRDSYHCIEAWRHAILLYCLRVFNRPPTAGKLRTISYTARVILDHIRCIRGTAVMQKQTLLPLFLAAAEVADNESRRFVREYCTHWSVAARYSMFTSALTLLEQIWEDWDASTRSGYWWGFKVGHVNRGPSGYNNVLASELLLG